MSLKPRVSIIVPLFNDEEWVSAALESCLRQTLNEIEVICVDDFSTDGTTAIVERYQRNDDRVRLVRHSVNRSAFQARRSGIEAAAAPYVLFLDGDDELAPTAAQRAVDHAITEAADIVGFGVDVIAPDGSTGGRFQDSLQPKHRALHGDEIVPAIFPVGRVAQGHLWRYLYKVEVLEEAYTDLPADLILQRANDLPITFRAFAAASKYSSIDDRLYRYYFRRGISGHRIDDLAHFGLYLGAVDSIDVINAAVRAKAQVSAGPEKLIASYESARLSIIGNVLNYCLKDVGEELQVQCIESLCAKAGDLDVIRAAANYCPAALDLLSRRASQRVPGRSRVRSVLLMSGNLRTGGVQGVLVAQAKYLLDAGFAVTVAVESLEDVAFELPEAVTVVGIDGVTLADKIRTFAELCRAYDVDVVINHHILYQERWPYFAMAACAIGVPTIGWLHNFALRTLMDFTTRGTFLSTHLPLLQKVVTLSASDVAFWRLRGVQNVVCLPNPPSPMLLGLPAMPAERELTDGPIELVWWGRLQQSTKQVRDLIEVAAELRAMDVDFRLTIVGPDSPELSASQLVEDARSRGVDDALSVLGPLHGDELIAALARADVHVSTSVIEGYPLTLVEAQALGVPVVMYDLPWLAYLENNEGVTTTAQGDVRGLAARIAELAQDPSLYAYRSKAALSAAGKARSIDFAELYKDLLRGSLPDQCTPEPTIEDARLLLDLIVFFSDRNVRIQGRKSARLQQAMQRREQAVRPHERIVALAEQMRVQQAELRAIAQGLPVDRSAMKVSKLTREVEVLRGSVSFRLGRLLTAIPRKVMAPLRGGPRA
jgi:glycosyltransferase involved in cell wall biosynthesis